MTTYRVFRYKNSWDTWISLKNGEYDIQINFTNDFPANPPQIKFIPPIYHPNVKNDGSINLALLETSRWTKEISLIDILLSVQILLNVPDENLIANSEANNAFLRYKENNFNDEYVKKVKNCISKPKPDSTIDNPSSSIPVESSTNQNHQNASRGLSKPFGTFFILIAKILIIQQN